MHRLNASPNTSVSRHSPCGYRVLEDHEVNYLCEIESVEIVGAHSVNRGNVR